MKTAVITDDKFMDYAADVVAETEELIELMSMIPAIELLLAKYTSDIMVKVFSEENLVS